MTKTRTRTRLREIALGACLLFVLAVGFSPSALSASPPQEIDVAICLDTSSSMEHLIGAARLKLWEIVNDLALLDPPPQLRVALVTYGGQHYDPKQGWVRMETPFTTDLDLVSEKLFALEVGGGNEYVARVLKTAVEDLQWSDDPDSVKLLFLAGNEKVDQDKQLDHRSAAAGAYHEDIELHVIFCGLETNPLHDSWKDLADVSGGHFATINYRTQSLSLKTPFDKELVGLGSSFNDTFVPMGQEGVSGREIQANQDRNAADLGEGAAATRALTKASSLYSRHWDLLDAIKAGRVDLDDIDVNQLPEELQEMSAAEREAYVFDLQAEREEIRRRILELGAQRRQYVAQQIKEKGLDDSRTFDGVVRRAIREQAERRGLRSADGD